MTIDEVRNMIEGCKAGITYKIKNLITGRVLCDRTLVPLKFKSESEAESFIVGRGLCLKSFEVIAVNSMRVAWSKPETAGAKKAGGDYDD